MCGTRGNQDQTGCPVLRDCLAWMECRVTEHLAPGNHSLFIGEVVEILGDHLAPGMATDVAIRAHDIPLDWPDAVEQEISS